jgi:hypothetical protein
MTGTIVAVTPLHSEAFARGARLLRTALGPAIATFLEDTSIVALRRLEQLIQEAVVTVPKADSRTDWTEDRRRLRTRPWPGSRRR